MSNYYIFKKYFFTFVIIFFTELYTYSMECPICYEEIKKDEKINLSCGHSFCKSCCYDHIMTQIKTMEKIKRVMKNAQLVLMELKKVKK